MARIEINVKYGANEEIDKILEVCKNVVDVDIDKETAVVSIQKFLQDAFDEGRRFQNNHKDFSL